MPCPHGHAHTTDTAPVEVGVSGDGPTLYSCNGQCGDPICEALFKTEGGLRQHIRQRQGLQVWCTYLKGYVYEGVHVCVCVCACVSVYMCACVCVCVCICNLCMCVHVYLCACVCVYVCVCMYLCAPNVRYAPPCVYTHSFNIGAASVVHAISTTSHSAHNVHCTTHTTST